VLSLPLSSRVEPAKRKGRAHHQLMNPSGM
jgi:hypothetical protein